MIVQYKTVPVADSHYVRSSTWIRIPAKIAARIPRQSIVVATLVFGTVVSVTSWLGAMRSESALLQTQLTAAATNRVLAIQREFEVAANAARAGTALLSISPNLPLADVDRFIRAVPSDRLPVQTATSISNDPGHNISLAVAKSPTGDLFLQVSIADITERALSYLKPHGLDVSLYEGGRRIFYHRSRMHGVYKAYPWEALRGAILPHNENWTFAGRAFRIECSPVPGYLGANSTWQPFGLLAFCLLGTVLLAALFDALITHARGVEKLVNERTAELAQARDAALEASILKSRFLANVSHEIRTPLNGVLGMTEFLLDAPLDSEQRECALTIRQSGNLLLHLINDLLDLSKIEAGQFSLDAEPFDLAETLQAAIDNAGEIAHAKGLVFTLNHDSKIPRFQIGDSLRFSQVMLNLLGNAVKFTDTGSIAFIVSQTSAGLGFQIRDTGPGISPEMMNRLFQRFVQADGSNARRYGGAGLGLAICKELVLLMGGRLWAESAPGAGSTFFFEIPSRPAPSQPTPFQLDPPRRYRAASAIPAPPPVLCLPAHGARILIVEDNYVNQKVTAGMVRKLGYEVDIAANGVEGVSAHRDNTYAAILMDCQMPEMDGFEATRHIRDRETSQTRTPIIALTASAMLEDRERCLEASMDDHLAKPLQFQALKQALDRWCPAVAEPV